MIFRLSLLLLSLLLGACSSTEENKTPDLMSQKMSDRFSSSRRRMGNMNDRNIYDKAMQSGYTKGKDTAGWLGKKSYKANEYTGSKSFKARDFKAGEFSGAKNKSSMGNDDFAQGAKVSAAADDSFKTADSRFSQKTSRQGSQVFSGADDLYKTPDNREAAKSMKKDNTPKAIKLEEQSRSPAYSEEQVRRLLGRQ
jgi:hypothetical protein